MRNWYLAATRNYTEHTAFNWRKMRNTAVGVGIAGLGVLTPTMLHQHEPPITWVDDTSTTRPTGSTSQPPSTQPATKPVSDTRPSTSPTISPTSKPTTQPTPQRNKGNGKPNMLVSRVLFSETASVSPQERQLVASVLMNRIGNKAFGGATSLQGVVTQPKAFEALNDPNNSNWSKTAEPSDLTDKEKKIWDECVNLSAGNFAPARGPSGRPIVYYHDKSTTKPKNWDNSWFTAHKEVETPHFIFYSVVPVSK
jgi:hypothetical protein